MDNFKEEVKYFVDLVNTNIEKAKNKKGGKIQTIFNNVNVRLDGEEVLVYNSEKDYIYNLYKKDIEKHKEKDNWQWLNVQVLALRYIDRLAKYSKKEITFEEMAGMPKKIPKVVKNLLEQKSTISEQLKLLRKNRNIPEVQAFVEECYNDKDLSEFHYTKYLIDRYYYNKKDLVRPKKNALESWGKLLFWCD